MVFAPHEAAHYTTGSQPLSPISDGGWIRIDTQNSAAIGGYVQWLAKNLKYSERLPLLTPATRFIVPHVYASSDWTTKLVLINTDAASNTAAVRLLDGGMISEKPVTLAPHEKMSFTVGGLFEEAAESEINQCGLSIDASQPLAGYFAFETASDHLYFPLLETDKADASLVIAHVASNGYWWTCANLFNPSETQAASLRLIPYDSQGQAIEGLIQSRELLPQKKDVFTIYDLWGESGGSIGFVKVEVTAGPPVVGLYAYGNMGNSMVAGIPFKRKR